jgi:hypothetical protein
MTPASTIALSTNITTFAAISGTARCSSRGPGSPGRPDVRRPESAVNASEPPATVTIVIAVLNSRTSICRDRRSSSQGTPATMTAPSAPTRAIAASWMMKLKLMSTVGATR